MHLGKSYRPYEFVVWTRRNIYGLLVVSLLPTLLYQVLGFKWLTLPLSVVTLLGTAATFVVGFKNVQTYARTVEAQRLWMSIVSASRFWGLIVRNFVGDAEQGARLVDRHMAWLTALRYQLRTYRVWESVESRSNAEYRKHYVIPERAESLEAALARHLPPGEIQSLALVDSKAVQLLATQGAALRELLGAGVITAAEYAECNSRLRELLDLQGQAERIKNFPYPRQYAVVNRLFVRFFCVVLPFGLTSQFDQLNQSVGGFMQGHMVWLAVPFSLIVSWIYTSLEQVGESTENPFEGGANDVPISQLSTVVERDVKQMHGRADLPALNEEKGIVL
ncbi:MULTISPECIES: bestrophin family protein [unclassified Achromobacter]|uniref:bestrophin family protein n=1 Tax=unclassified Achromobacter TaxID=2626865 RepID=UPI000B5157F1|nr:MULTISPECIES: bestrophin family ion channel [unclassified Achromobacter]OWT80744.1 multidrug transporter [Achromobacter sp. HZ34]OWT81260.1 multidrug transporter [Achromobacter sp. HZ28]